MLSEKTLSINFIFKFKFNSENTLLNNPYNATGGLF